MSRKAFFVTFVVVVMSLFALPVRADLPPRPDNETAHKSVVGGAIQLHVSGYREGLWAVVQWQDGLGNWHDVEGWRGALSEEQKMWWVAEKDFSTGPFRWTLYDGVDGDLLSASESFDLPHGHRQVVHVTVLLSP